MGADAFSAAVLAAASSPLAPVIQELERAGYGLHTGEVVILPNGLQESEAPPACWSADFPSDDGRLVVVLSIGGKDGAWGISLTADTYRLQRVAYWEAVGGPLLATEQEWPGLEAAVQKARSLAIQHRGAA